ATVNSTSLFASLTNPAYFGNPTPNFLGQDPGEKFVYLNVIGTSGTTFDQVRFVNSLNTGFEADNFSIRAAPLTSPFPGTPLLVPEPATLLMAAIGLPVAASLWRCRRRRRAA